MMILAWEALVSCVYDLSCAAFAAVNARPPRSCSGIIELVKFSMIHFLKSLGILVKRHCAFFLGESGAILVNECQNGKVTFVPFNVKSFIQNDINVFCTFPQLSTGRVVI